MTGLIIITYLEPSGWSIHKDEHINVLAFGLMEQRLIDCFKNHVAHKNYLTALMMIMCFDSYMNQRSLKNIEVHGRQ